MESNGRRSLPALDEPIAEGGGDPEIFAFCKQKSHPPATGWAAAATNLRPPLPPIALRGSLF
jgi:hypothetical protein